MEKLRSAQGLTVLLKLIEVRQPLSLQVHPDDSIARSGFNRENRQGVPLHSPQRIFRDRNGKPEMYVALTPSYLFAGIRPTIDWCRDPVCSALFYGGLNKNSSNGRGKIQELVKRISTSSKEQVRFLSRRALPLLKGENKKGASVRLTWLQKIFNSFGMNSGDPAALLTPFLKFYELPPGDGIYLSPGVPHMFLQGVGLEISGDSDNVLRMGLTSKATHFKRAVRVLRSDRNARLLRSQGGALDVKLAKTDLHIRGLHGGVKNIQIKSKNFIFSFCLDPFPGRVGFAFLKR
jgi:mannose-6-phosphate isomerase